MVLPPGFSARAVPGISPTLEKELYEAAGELAAWIDYLQQPESNDGPRIYRPREAGAGPSDLEMPGRVDSLDAQGNVYETVSVLERFAGDTDAFFRAAQAVSGIIPSIIERTYDKLAKGCLTWSRDGVDRAPDDGNREPGQELPVREPVTATRYPELHPAGQNWLMMRLGAGWIAPENLAAHLYESDFLPFQVYTENGVYIVAEHLARYVAIFDKAVEDIAKLMRALTEKFANPPGGSGGASATFDVPSIVITAVVAVATTVITGGITKTRALVAVALEVLGEAAKTAQTRLVLENHGRFQDTAQQYLDGVSEIEREVAEAITQLTDSLRNKLDELRFKRKYEAMPDEADRSGLSTQVPHIGHYTDGVRTL